jgi:hypothetical protein
LSQTGGIQENTTGLFFCTVFSVIFCSENSTSFEIVIMEECPGTNNKNLPLVIPLTCVVALCHMVNPS